jgi:hypothetical protein
VSDFDQIPAAKGRRLRVAGEDVGHKASRIVGRVVMSKVDEFREYADEAMRWARNSKTEKDKAILIDLARTLTQAASYRECTVERAPVGGPPRIEMGLRSLPIDSVKR